MAMPAAPPFDWREPILKRFSPTIRDAVRVSVVADPDQIMADESVVDMIRAAGFDLLVHDDPIAFRYAYETRHRKAWDRGDWTSVVVTMNAPSSDFNLLPYDVLALARADNRMMSFGLADLFPGLAPGIVASLDRAGRDTLARAMAGERTGQMGEGASIDFVLRHVYGVLPEQIREPAGLLRLLLQRHYHERVWPPVVDEHLLRLLRQEHAWQDWPLEDILPDRSAFLAFLQERWPRFLQRAIAPEDQLGEVELAYGWRFQGAGDLPFDAPGVKEVLDNLFTEGLLAPVKFERPEALSAAWMLAGVAASSPSDEAVRYSKLLAAAEEDLPDCDASASVWLVAAQRWAEAVALRWRLRPSVLDPEVGADADALQDRIEAAFADWMDQHFAGLANRSFLPRPVMTHQIAPFLAHRTQADAVGRRRPKQALLVMDGLALDQWVLLREQVAACREWRMEDGALFAWVPTITAVARQAIFAGREPLYFAQSIGGTAKEAQHWQRFWEDHGAGKDEVAYACHGEEPDAAFLQRLHELAEHPRLRILGLVVGTVDRMLHGSVLGTDGLHASVRHWVGGGAFHRLVELLVRNHYEVFVTADHGNVQCTGIGPAATGAVPDEKGSRALVFRDEAKLRQEQVRLAGSRTWPPAGLPEGYFPLLASGRNAFVKRGASVVTHGGIALEEVIVPFARIAAAS